MKIIKEKILASVGIISTLVGGTGVAIAGIGLCICIWAPIFSAVGALSFGMAFLSRYHILFIILGIVSLIISFILYKRKKVCRIHKKTDKKDS